MKKTGKHNKQIKKGDKAHVKIRGENKWIEVVGFIDSTAGSKDLVDETSDFTFAGKDLTTILLDEEKKFSHTFVNETWSSIVFWLAKYYELGKARIDHTSEMAGQKQQGIDQHWFQVVDQTGLAVLDQAVAATKYYSFVDCSGNIVFQKSLKKRGGVVEVVFDGTEKGDIETLNHTDNDITEIKIYKEISIADVGEKIRIIDIEDPELSGIYEILKCRYTVRSDASGEFLEIIYNTKRVVNG